MLKVWMLTIIFRMDGVSTQQYQFTSQRDCLLAKEYVIENSFYAKDGFCLQVDK